MISDLTHVTVLVEDADEAIEWYTDKLGFELRDDEAYEPGMRWVTVAPEGGDVEIALQQPTDEFGEAQAAEMRDRIGKATPTVLAVDDCRATVAELRDRGVEITLEPEEMPWGTHANIVDLYGNPYNLLESAE
ncbi:VOC family protein [Haloferax namakaokahaiae]|uniref:VOC family protein n=1 Tax=Haloferax namakaokahaiae TaxID=1748331 RepID=A0ABD5ZAT5_9EURY